ncbi:MAG: hypothetical protein ACP5VS_06710 [Desulfomonilaceae bacterium]
MRGWAAEPGFSEPQPGVRRLIDLEGLRWPSLQVHEPGLAIAATCKISQLYSFTGPPEWRAAPLIRQCCQSLLASFKIWNTATVGGNPFLSIECEKQHGLSIVAGRFRS